MIFGFENRLIFTPARFRAECYAKITNLPYTVEDVFIPSSDGVLLHAWYCPHPEARLSVLFSHGNTGNISDRVHELSYFHAAKANILLYDYRGYGKSSGKPTEEGVYADARAANHWLAERTKIPPSSVVQVGRSLGGAIAVDLAAECGAAGLILECTFSSLADVAQHRYPYFLLGRLMAKKMNSAAKIANYRGPLLQVHGDLDKVVPIALGRKLFEQARGPKHFVEVKGGSHHDIHRNEYTVALNRFLGKLTLEQRPDNSSAQLSGVF